MIGKLPTAPMIRIGKGNLWSPVSAGSITSQQSIALVGDYMREVLMKSNKKDDEMS